MNRRERYTNNDGGISTSFKRTELSTTSLIIGPTSEQLSYQDARVISNIASNIVMSYLKAEEEAQVFSGSRVEHFHFLGVEHMTWQPLGRRRSLQSSPGEEFLEAGYSIIDFRGAVADYRVIFAGFPVPEEEELKQKMHSALFPNANDPFAQSDGLIKELNKNAKFSGITSADLFYPTQSPTDQPSSFPSSELSSFPSGQPSLFHSGQPSLHPSGKPSLFPSSQPSLFPSSQHSSFPTSQPSLHHSIMPSLHHSMQPSLHYSSQPSALPSIPPPSSAPSSLPSLVASEFIEPASAPSDELDTESGDEIAFGLVATKVSTLTSLNNADTKTTITPNSSNNSAPIMAAFGALVAVAVLAVGFVWRKRRANKNNNINAPSLSLSPSSSLRRGRKSRRHHLHTRDHLNAQKLHPHNNNSRRHHPHVHDDFDDESDTDASSIGPVLAAAVAASGAPKTVALNYDDDDTTATDVMTLSSPYNTPKGGHRHTSAADACAILTPSHFTANDTNSVLSDRNSEHYNDFEPDSEWNPDDNDHDDNPHDFQHDTTTTTELSTEPHSIGERIGSFLANRFRNDVTTTGAATTSSTSPAAAAALGTSNPSQPHLSSLDTFSADETDSEGGHFV